MAEQLTDDEIKALRALVPLADEVKQHAEYRLAKRLVFKTYRQIILTLAGTISAVYLLRDHIRTILGI